MWEQIQQLFQQFSTRYDATNASVELIIMLAMSFLLGFLFCYVQSK